jgi:hypothetical protein
MWTANRGLGVFVCRSAGVEKIFIYISSTIQLFATAVTCTFPSPSMIDSAVSHITVLIAMHDVIITNHWTLSMIEYQLSKERQLYPKICGRQRLFALAVPQISDISIGNIVYQSTGSTMNSWSESLVYFMHLTSHRFHILPPKLSGP